MESNYSCNHVILSWQSRGQVVEICSSCNKVIYQERAKVIAQIWSANVVHCPESCNMISWFADRWAYVFLFCWRALCMLVTLAQQEETASLALSKCDNPPHVQQVWRLSIKQVVMCRTICWLWADDRQPAEIPGCNWLQPRNRPAHYRL